MWELVGLSHYATDLSEAGSVFTDRIRHLSRWEKIKEGMRYILQTVARFKGDIQLKIEKI